jgi:hypothetical protein
MRLWTSVVTVLVAASLLASCGGVGEESGREETTAEETIEGTDQGQSSTPVSPQEEWMNASPEEKEAIKARDITEGPKRPEVTPPEYEVVEISPGVAATDLSQAKAIVLVTGFGERSYGEMVNGPVLQEIADEILADNPEYQMLVADFYSGPEQRQDRLMGSRYSFESQAVEREFTADVESALDELSNGG